MILATILAASEHGESFWEEVLGLLSDPAHWVQEATAELLFFTLQIFLIDKLIHAHRKGKNLDEH